MNEDRAAKSIEHLSELTTYIDRLSGKFPLRSHATLRSQLRRSAIDALSHAACATEAVSLPDFRRLYSRTLGALIELETFARMAAKSRALTPTEEAQVLLLAGMASHSVRLCLTASAGELEEWAAVPAPVAEAPRESALSVVA